MSGQFNKYINDESRQRLQKMHDKRTSRSEAIAAIIKKGLNRKVLKSSRIINGEVNEVYEVVLDDDKEIILRIGHIEERSFEAETWAIEQSKRVGVPVANVLAIGSMTETGKTLHYSIQERLHGRLFDNLLWTDNISTDRAQKITEQAGEILARIHRVTITTGYGSIDGSGHGRFSNVSEWVKYCLAKRDSYAELFSQHGLTADELDRILDRFKRAELLFVQKSHLLHMDYGPKHIFVDGNDKITGIIDFERAESGDASLDFASWDYWFKDKLPTEWLMTGYKKVSSLGDDFDERLATAKIPEMLYLLNYYTNVEPLKEVATAGATALKELAKS